MDVWLAAAQRQRSHGDLVNLSAGQPSVGAPEPVRAAAAAALQSNQLGYTVALGIPELRSVIAGSYADRYGLAVDPDDVVVTTGSSGGFLLAFLACFDVGDRVAIASPGYPCYRNILSALGCEVIEIPCGPETRFQPTAAALAEIPGPLAGVIVASPANPTGSIIAAAELAAIAKVCRGRGIRIVSDEIYHGLSYGEPTRSMLEFEPAALVVNSFSKYFSMAGWRLGWLVAPGAAAERARAYVGNLFLTAPVLSQHAGLAAMAAREELDGHVAVYRKNRQLLLEALPKLGLATIAPPDGAFYIWADIGHLTNDSLAFCENLLRDTGVATAPGLDFDPVDGGRFMRFSFAVSTAEVEDAIGRMIPWFAGQAQ
jgi:aspartate/methionine/tyrosine aminotransferase